MSLTYAAHHLYSQYHFPQHENSFYSLPDCSRRIRGRGCPHRHGKGSLHGILKAIGNDAQKASLNRCEKARARTEKKRADLAKEVAEQTKRNDAGMKKTIMKRHLNNMLPACDRAPEEPRDPGDYTIRF